MIFSRARERAEALSKKTNDTFTESIKDDVMEIARNSFTSNKNPFINNTKNIETIKDDNYENTTNSNTIDESIGFKQRNVNTVKENIQNSHKILNEHIANYEIMQTMQQTKADNTNKKTFVGALNFLNSQAAVTLNNGKGKRFQALA